MHIKNKKNLFAATFMVSMLGLAVFTGCGLWKKNDTTETTEGSVAKKDDVLLVIGGKPVLTVAEYEDQLTAARQAHQEIEMLLQMMPNAEKDYIFQGIMTGKIMQEWANKEGIDKDPEFKKQLKQMVDAMALNLYVKAFYDKYPVEISDADVKDFYDTKKDEIKGLQIAQGGTHVVYVRFDAKDKAEKFLEKVKEIKDASKFQAIAKADNLVVADAIINEGSPISDTLKSAVLDIKKFPKKEIVKVGDNAFWVLLATGKSDAKYHDFKSPDVQQGLKKMMTDERRQKQLEEFIKKMKTELDVKEHLGYFEQKENQKKAAMEAMMKQGKDDADQDGKNDQAVEDATIPAKKI